MTSLLTIWQFVVWNSPYTLCASFNGCSCQLLDGNYPTVDKFIYTNVHIYLTYIVRRAEWGRAGKSRSGKFHASCVTNNRLAVLLILLRSTSLTTGVSTVPPGTGDWLFLPLVHMLDFGLSQRHLASRWGNRLEVTVLAKRWHKDAACFLWSPWLLSDDYGSLSHYNSTECYI